MDEVKALTPAGEARDTERTRPSRRTARDVTDGAAVPAGTRAEGGRKAPRGRRRWPWLLGLLLAGASVAAATRMLRGSRDRSTDLLEDEYPDDRFDSNGITPAPRRQPAGDQFHHSPN